jgi:anti-sigma B factor antagonist
VTAPDLPRCIEVQRRNEGEAVVVRVTGELDTMTVPLLENQLIAVEADLVAPAPLVLDLSDLGFMSSAGLVLLVTNHERCTEQGSRMWVVTGDNRRVLRPVLITGLDADLNLVATVADALHKDR